MAEIVYIFTNPVMPGVVKIGRTGRKDVMERARELFTTAVPVPFDCAYACEVEDNATVEKALHERFARYRIDPRREYFWLTTRTAIKALKAYEVTDATPAVRAEADSRLSDSKRDIRRRARQVAEKRYPEYARGKDLHTRIKGEADKR